MEGSIFSGGIKTGVHETKVELWRLDNLKWQRAIKQYCSQDKIDFAYHI